MKAHLHGPMDMAKEFGLQFWAEGTWTCQKQEIYLIVPVVVWRRKRMHRTAPVAKQ
ncbi:unnamed protein product [Sphacelaria rigidula]